MKFWDTSAVVPLVVVQPATREMRALAEADPSMVVWWATRTECVSALARLARNGTFTSKAEGQARSVLSALATAWSEISPSTPLRERAERLLAVHPLRAADAFQLSAALLWARGRTAMHAFISFDTRLRAAAVREGFRVLPENGAR